MGCFCQTPPLKGQGSMQKRREKGCRSQRWGMTPKKASSRPNRTGTQGNSQRLDSTHRFKPDKNRHGERKIDTEFHPWPRKKLLVSDTGWERDDLFSSVECPWVYQGKAPFPGVVGQHKIDSIWVCVCVCVCTFSLIFFSYWFFSLLFSLFLFFIVFLIFALRENTKLDGQGGGTRRWDREVWESWENGKNIIKCQIYCIKILIKLLKKELGYQDSEYTPVIGYQVTTFNLYCKITSVSNDSKIFVT